MSTGDGCLSCLDALDQEELRLAAMTSEQRKDYARIYGIDLAALGKTGPSVVSLNGVVASLAVTEFMVMITGLRAPARMQRFTSGRRHETVSVQAGTARRRARFCSGAASVTCTDAPPSANSARSCRADFV